MVAGLRSMLAARSDVKREFRIQPTVLQRGRNNPVKFAASDKHALAALLEPSQPAEQDVREIVNDLVLHEIATLAATQAAARSLLERLGPDQLDEEDSGMNILPGAREKRLWQAYCRLHKQMTEQFDDDFDSVFGKAFARAYEDEAARRRG
jgi:type VI secretion system protein ImpI/type VI secretion system protein